MHFSHIQQDCELHGIDICHNIVMLVVILTVCTDNKMLQDAKIEKSGP